MMRPLWSFGARVMKAVEGVFHREKLPVERSPDPAEPGSSSLQKEEETAVDISSALQKFNHFKQLYGEMQSSQSIREKQPQRETEASNDLLKIVMSKDLGRSLFLRHTEDLLPVYLDLIESVTAEPDENKAKVLGDKTFELVKLAAQKAGRLSAPGTVLESIVLLADILRRDGVQILDMVEDQEGATCEILCGTRGCDSVETIWLSKPSLDDIREKRSIHMCPLHRF